MDRVRSLRRDGLTYEAIVSTVLGDGIDVSVKTVFLLCAGIQNPNVEKRRTLVEMVRSGSTVSRGLQSGRSLDVHRKRLVQGPRDLREGRRA